MKTSSLFNNTSNQHFTNAHQRWEIEPEFNELGQEQSLPQPVYDFFVGNRFSPMSEDALANMIIALDDTQIPEIKDWWRQSNSVARLANAYFHGFLSEAESECLVLFD